MTVNTNQTEDIKLILSDIKQAPTVPQPEQLSNIVVPNTVSPHAHEVKPVCDPYVKYVDNAISADLKDRLITFMDENDSKFKSIGGCRDTIYYGEYGYKYVGGEHEACRTPEIFQDLLEMIRPNMSDPSAWINSCLITRYKSGEDYIPPHSDDELFFDPSSEILTVSIGAKRTMSFSDSSSSTKKELELNDCSVLVSSRLSQDFWKHGIDADSSVAGLRYSFTFRHIAPHFVNSTVIVGDSNTKHLKFGTGQGSFGRWMPGKRIEALHVEEIPDPVHIGPYRNIVIHTGINNVKQQSRKSNKTLVNELEKKCNNIHETYPRARLYISLLLPTKLQSLNHCVNEFNNLILDMAYKYKHIRVIDNSLLGGYSGCLSEEFGRWNVNEGCPNSTDVIHLGKLGLRKFGYKIKMSVINIKNGKFSGNSRAAAQRSHQVGRLSST